MGNHEMRDARRVKRRDPPRAIGGGWLPSRHAVLWTTSFRLQVRATSSVNSSEMTVRSVHYLILDKGRGGRPATGNSFALLTLRVGARKSTLIVWCRRNDMVSISLRSVGSFKGSSIEFERSAHSINDIIDNEDEARVIDIVVDITESRKH